MNHISSEYTILKLIMPKTKLFHLLNLNSQRLLRMIEIKQVTAEWRALRCDRGGRCASQAS